MKTALLTAAALLLATPCIGKADAAMMIPEYLIGQWCGGAQTPGAWLKNIEGRVRLEGDYIRAKNVCKDTRPMIFDIHRFGFWIKFADMPLRILCTPQKVEDFAHGWSVVADCRAEDLSASVYRMGFTFESWRQNEVAITRWAPLESDQ